MLTEYLSVQFSRRHLIRVKFKSTVRAGAYSGFLASFVALRVSIGFLTTRSANVSVRFYEAQLTGQMVRLPRNDSEIFTGTNARSFRKCEIRDYEGWRNPISSLMYY